MANLQMWAAIVGFVLPIVMAVVNQSKWPSGLKAVAVFAASLLVSIGTVYLQGPADFTLDRWITASLTTLVTAIATYHGLWKPTGAAPALEESTDVTSTPSNP